jgi:adenylate kinase
MKNQLHPSVLLFGAPGVGKGTQGAVLGRIPGFFHFAMGDAFRSLDPNSELGKVAAGYSSRGELVPDEVTIQLWKESMAAHIREGRYTPGKDLLVLDGVPRSVRQVELLRDQIDVLCVVHLACTTDEAREEMFNRLRNRALEQDRADDAKEEVISRRWNVYHAETQPVLEQYPEELIANIDPMGTPAEVVGRVLAVVAPIQKGLCCCC